MKNVMNYGKLKNMICLADYVENILFMRFTDMHKYIKVYFSKSEESFLFFIYSRYSLLSTNRITHIDKNKVIAINYKVEKELNF